MKVPPTSNDPPASAPDSGLTLAQQVAGSLLGGPVEIRQLRGGGRNSRIFEVRHGARTFALKQYPSPLDDPRDRLATEVGALRLMAEHAIDVVPGVVAVDRERGFALLTWMEGADLGAVTDADIDA